MSLCNRSLIRRHSGAIVGRHSEHDPMPFPDSHSAPVNPDGTPHGTDPRVNPSLAIPTPTLALEASLA